MNQFQMDKVIHRHRETGTGASFTALRVRELAVTRGERIAVVGPNGAGKSTLLLTLAALQRPTEGALFFNEKNVWHQGLQLATRRSVPMLLQQSYLFNMTVLKNVMYGLRVRGIPHRQARLKAETALASIEMLHLAHRHRHELSGGEIRRVALATVLTLEPEAILLDEPTVGLDVASRQIIENLLLQANREHGVTLIFASHQSQATDSLANRVVTLTAGRLIDQALGMPLRGQLRRNNGSFEFQTSDGSSLSLDLETIMQDPWLELDASAGPCDLTIVPTGMSVSREQGDHCWPGVISDVRTRGDSITLKVDVQTVKITVTLSRGDYDRMQLNIGSSVYLTPQKNAICAIPR